jgi:hypothetical protein
MEFFQEIHYPGLGVSRLKQSLTIQSLPDFCTAITTATASSEGEGELYCLWGSFTVRRGEIRNGVRYALIDCPHALAWTVTLDDAREHVIVHCTIDKTHPDPEFAESIEDFVSDWADGLREHFRTPAEPLALASL